MAVSKALGIPVIAQAQAERDRNHIDHLRGLLKEIDRAVWAALGENKSFFSAIDPAESIGSAIRKLQAHREELVQAQEVLAKKCDYLAGELAEVCESANDYSERVATYERAEKRRKAAAARKRKLARAKR